MDTENKITMTAEQADLTSTAAATEEKAPIAPPEKGTVRNTKKKTRTLDNLLSALLLLLLLCLSGVLYFLVSENTNSGVMPMNLANYLLYATYIFMGLGLFFATRTGDGKNVYRVNWFSLILVVLPMILLALGYVLRNEQILIEGPYFDATSWVLDNGGIVFQFGMIILGYAIPYSFISGFERHMVEAPDEITEVSAEATESTEAGEIAEPVTDNSVESVEAGETTALDVSDSGIVETGEPNDDTLSEVSAE